MTAAGGGAADEQISIKCRAPFASDAELARLTEGFLDLSLPEKCWTHDAHWAVALDVILNHPERDLPREMPELISRFNLAKGLANTESAGYHETITQASLIMARHFLSSAGAAKLKAWQAANGLMASPLGKSDWPLAYWSKDLLMSPAARRQWVQPDVKALPNF